MAFGLFLTNKCRLGGVSVRNLFLQTQRLSLNVPYLFEPFIAICSICPGTIYFRNWRIKKSLEFKASTQGLEWHHSVKVFSDVTIYISTASYSPALYTVTLLQSKQCERRLISEDHILNLDLKSHWVLTVRKGTMTLFLSYNENNSLILPACDLRPRWRGTE